MLSRLLYLVFVVAIGWLIGRLVGGARRRRVRTGRRTVSDGEPMVRDRVCNTFLARSRAIAVDVGGEEHFFCSERCRSRFLEQSEAGGP